MQLSLFLVLLVLKKFPNFVVITFDLYSPSSKRKASISSKLPLYFFPTQSIFTSLWLHKILEILSKTRISTDSTWQEAEGIIPGTPCRSCVKQELDSPWSKEDTD